MLLFLCLLFFQHGSTAVITTNKPGYTSLRPTSASALGGVLPSLQLAATPNYPVAAGQAVHLHCSAASGPASYTTSFSWQHLENNTWHAVSNGTDLTLDEPSESGLYRCLASSVSSGWVASRNHTVFIVAVLPTEKETLEVAALALSLLALTISLAASFCLGYQTCCAATSPVSDTHNGSPRLEKTPNHPQAEDGGVYMNYKGTPHPYTDLDPTKMTVDSIYSTLS